MPRRAKPDLSPVRREAMIRELRIFGERERQAELDKLVYVAMAYHAGMTVRDIAEVFGVTSSTATRWKEAGERERRRRGSGDPERSGER